MIEVTEMEPVVTDEDLLQAVKNFQMDPIALQEGDWFLFEDGRVLHICHPTPFAHGMWRDDTYPGRRLFGYAATLSMEFGTNYWNRVCGACGDKPPKRIRVLYLMRAELKNVV